MVVGVATILGETSYYLLKGIFGTLVELCREPPPPQQEQEQEQPPIAAAPSFDAWNESRRNSRFPCNSVRRTQFFLNDHIPFGVVIGGYILSLIAVTVVIPQMFTGVKWQHMVLLSLITPVMASVQARMLGGTDWTHIEIFGLICMLLAKSLMGHSTETTFVSIVFANVLFSSVSAAGQLMFCFKVGYMTLTSTLAILAGYIIGVVMGCVINTSIFMLYHNNYSDFGSSTSVFPVPSSNKLWDLANVDGGVVQFSDLSTRCQALSMGCFVGAMAIALIRDVLERKKIKGSELIPVPSAVALPIFVNKNKAVTVILGVLVRLGWKQASPPKAARYGPSVVAGLICAEMMAMVVMLPLHLMGIKPPMCGMYLSGNELAICDQKLKSKPS